MWFGHGKFRWCTDKRREILHNRGTHPGKGPLLTTPYDITAVTLILVVFVGSGAPCSLGWEVAMAVGWAPCLVDLTCMLDKSVGHIVVPGYAHDDEGDTDERAVSAPCVFYSHIGEDAAESLRYGGSHSS